MVKYRPVTSRFQTIRRSDGVEHLLVPTPRCRVCFLPIQLKFATWGLCRNCNDGSPVDGLVLDRVVAATLYVPEVIGYPHTQEILALKDDGSHAAAYAGVLKSVLADEGIDYSSAALVPIPVTFERPQLAGPRALAKALSGELGIPVRHVLTFTRFVQSQKGLNREEREANVRDSMNGAKNPHRSTILLVDDVVTTGNMMREGARAVRAASSVAQTVVGVAAGRDASLKTLLFTEVIEPVEG